MFNMQNAIRTKYPCLYNLHVERDGSSRWGTEEPTPIILSDDYFYALGAVKAYLTNVAKTLSGDLGVVEHLEDFITTTVVAIGEYEEALHWEIPFKRYDGRVVINENAQEFEATFEYQSNHFYIKLDKVDTQNVHVFMKNLV